MAQLAAVTTESAVLLDGDDDLVRPQLDAVSVLDAATADRLALELDGCLRTARIIATLRAGLEVEIALDAVEPTPEAAAMFEFATWASMDDAGLATRLARMGDAVNVAMGRDPTVLTQLGTALSRRRRWAEAAIVLEEVRGRDPRERDGALRLAIAYAMTDRWADAKVMLVPLLASSHSRWAKPSVSGKWIRVT